ncbi:Uncharacterized protein SCF082_LOCUS48839 [Durusdinium trenchii]|uniref:Uncharacterized protein n=1 Tax=Durusdinium trenchii TaxID=1381693 RepID=A0ABP0RYU3_9DINO
MLEQDFEEALATAQKRMGRLEERLELQREGLQRWRRKSVQAAPVLAGHSLLHQSMLEASARERNKCWAECERLQALAEPEREPACQQLFVQCSGLQQLWKNCEDSSERMSQGLQKAADDNPNTGALLSAMDGALQAALDANSPRHVLLRAALQRLARLDDQLEQQRAALGARGRRRKNRAGPILPDETLAAFVEEEQEALTLLADTRDLLEPEAWQEMYDAWRAQVTSGLEQLAALGITVAGSGSDSSPKKNQSEAMVDPAEAMAEGRRRLRQLEDEYAKRNREACEAGHIAESL